MPVDLDELERLHKAVAGSGWWSALDFADPQIGLGASSDAPANAAFIAAIKNACDDGLLERLRTAEARIVQMDTVLRSARETILDLKNSRWSEMEGSDDDWVEDIDAVLKSTPQPIATESTLAALKAENERLRDGLHDLDNHLGRLSVSKDAVRSFVRHLAKPKGPTNDDQAVG